MAKGKIDKEINVRINLLKGIDQFKQLPKAMQKAIASTEARTNMYANKMARSYANVQSTAMKSQAQQDAFSAKTQQKQSVLNDKAQRKQEILANKQNKLSDLSNEFGYNVNEVSRSLAHYGYGIDDTGNIVDKAGQRVDFSRKQFIKSVPALRRFRAEYLSVMFAGMALKRSLDGIIQSQLELWGVTELVSAAWQVVMLPIMEMITPFIYDLLGGFMELPTAVKTGIGSLVGFGWILGNLLSGLGMTGLAWEGFASLFPDAAASVTTFIKSAGGLSGILGKAATVGIGIKFAVDSYQGFAEGDILAGIGGALGSTGAIVMLTGKKKAGNAIMAAGVVLQLVDTIFALGEANFQAKFDSLLTNIGLTAALAGGPVGWGIAIGVILSKVLIGTGFYDYLFEKLEQIKYEIDKFFGKETKAQRLRFEPQTLTYAGAVGAPSFSSNTQEQIKQEESGITYENAASMASLTSMNDGIITPGGVVETDPADYIIATKNPESLAENSNVTLNVTYNVSVSDKREMQSMLDSNNRRLTEDVRRLINA